MRQLLSVAIAGSLGGCSLIYNPSNLPAKDIDAAPMIDAMIDAEIIKDADPTMLAITAVAPQLVMDGQGDGGSRPQMIVVTGTQIVQGAKITLTDHTTHAAYAGAVVDDANTIVGDDGDAVAAPVKFLVQDALTSTSPLIRLDVTVTQMANGMMFTKTLAMDSHGQPALQVQPLDKLVDGKPPLAANALPGGTYTFAKVDIQTMTNAKGLVASDHGKPLIIRAIASINIKSPVAVDASGSTAGAGGNGGGAGGAASLTAPGAGMPGAGTIAGRGMPNGGGGGFGTKGDNGAGAGGTPSGERELLTLSTIQGVDSGAGGAGTAATTLANGGVGGGGGGTVELSAGGDLTLAGGVSANGGAATGTSAGNGGGGSGGAVLLRAGGALSVTGTVSVAGGPPGANANGGAGGVGGLGRVRVDASVASALGFQGPQFVAQPIDGTTGLVARTERPTITVHGTASTAFSYFFQNADGTKITSLMNATIAGNGLASFPLGADLYPGLNHLCLTPAGGTVSSLPEALNCVDLAYLYKLP